MLKAARWPTAARPAAVVVSAVAGLVLITVLANHTARSRAYSSTAQFKVWALIIDLAWFAFPLVWMTGVALLKQLKLPVRSLLRRNARWEALAVLAVLLIGWVTGSYGRPNQRPWFYLGVERIMVSYAASVIALYPIFLVFRHVYAESSPDKFQTVRGAELLDRIKLIRLRRRTLVNGLTAAGTLVSLGVLATGAQRQALLAVQAKAPSYPPVYIVVWGIVASGILIAGFVPGYRRLVMLGERTVDDAFPLLSPEDTGWRDRLADRTALTDLLQVTQGFKDVVNSALLVGAPLLSAAFSLLLPSSK